MVFHNNDFRLAICTYYPAPRVSPQTCTSRFRNANLYQRARMGGIPSQISMRAWNKTLRVDPETLLIPRTLTRFTFSQPCNDDRLEPALRYNNIFFGLQQMLASEPYNHFNTGTHNDELLSGRNPLRLVETPSPLSLFRIQLGQRIRLNSSSTAPYGQGHHLDLHLAADPRNSHRISFEIIRPFLPFTRSVALLVKPALPSVAKHLGLPRQFIAKINDRRFVDRQFGPPWTPAVEISLRVALDKIKAGIPCGNEFPELGPTDEDPDGPFEDWMQDISELKVMRSSLQREREAYRQLRPLQGTDIPKFYHTFYLPMPYTASSSPASPPNTPPPTENSESITPLLFDYVEGMAVEFIDGWNMEEITPGIEMSQATIEGASEEVLQIMHRVRKHDVSHDDIRLANIILRREYPHKPVLIDFGHADLRPEDCTLEKWRERLIRFDEVDLTRRSLSNAGLHVRSPPHPTDFLDVDPKAPYGFSFPNFLVEDRSPTWRSRFVERVEGPDYVLKEGLKWELPRWIVKKGVKTCNDERYQ